MCQEPAAVGHVRAAMPHPVAGRAADPIALAPADGVVVTTLVDNVYDALLTGDESVTRAPLAAGTARAPQFEPGRTTVGLMAEHGFSALVTVRRGEATTSVLFDTGLSPDAMVTNAGRLGLDLSGVHAVVLSHGHFDHAGGLAGLAGRRGTRSVPMVVHPLAWTRRLARPSGGADDWPTLSKHALTGEGFEVIERRQPSLLLDRSLLITGEVDRTTDFEHGMPPAHQHWTGTTWEPDPLILDDQAFVVNVRGKGLVIVTGCRARRRHQHHPPRPAAGRHPPAARTARRPAPGRRLLYPQHRPHGPCAHRTGTRPAGPRTLHRPASTTRPRRRAPRQLGPRQQRHPLPARRFLTPADMASPGGTSRDVGRPGPATET